MKILDRAVRMYGLTNDPAEAGFILPDGSLLDFSGGSRGQRGQRAYDHRQVESLFRNWNDQDSRWSYLYRFMRLGAIRIGFDRSYFWATLASRPTECQVGVVTRLARRAESVHLEIVDRHAEALRSYSGSFPMAYEVMEFLNGTVSAD